MEWGEKNGEDEKFDFWRTVRAANLWAEFTLREWRVVVSFMFDFVLVLAGAVWFFPGTYFIIKDFSLTRLAFTIVGAICLVIGIPRFKKWFQEKKR